jgi:D-alanine transaminase
VGERPLKVYLNGRFVPRDQACIPITDRGFLFGDSVYEVIPAYGGAPLRLEQHLDRLDRSLAAIHMANPLAHAEWAGVIAELTAQLPGQDQQLYIQVTRGAPEEREHRIPEGLAPTVLATTRTLPQRRSDADQQGISAITLDDIRWQRCDIKATTLLANVLAHHHAREEGVDEAILVRDGRALEGTASNLFIVSQGLLITPPTDNCILPGITRDLVLELAQEEGIPYAEASIGVADLEQAQEIWLTSSTREIRPVIRLNGKPVGDGQPGPLWQRTCQLLDAYKERLRLQAREGLVRSGGPTT